MQLFIATAPLHCLETIINLFCQWSRPLLVKTVAAMDFAWHNCKLHCRVFFAQSVWSDGIGWFIKAAKMAEKDLISTPANIIRLYFYNHSNELVTVCGVICSGAMKNIILTLSMLAWGVKAGLHLQPPLVVCCILYYKQPSLVVWSIKQLPLLPSLAKKHVVLDALCLRC